MTKKGYIKPTYRLGSDPQSRTLNSQNSSVVFRIAKIIRVDYENSTADLIYLDGFGAEPRVPISQGYIGLRGFLGAMPSVGDICILGYSKSGGSARPLIINYFPTGYKSAIKNDILDKPTDELSFDQRRIRPKMKKIYEGEIFASSKYGSDIYLDKDILISNANLNEIILKSSDNSISLNSINTYIKNSGLNLYSGPIHRNSLINDVDFKLPNSEFPIYYNSEGRAVYTVNLNSSINNIFPFGKETVFDDNPAFIEHRLEVKEYDDMNVPVTSFNSGEDIDSLYKRNENGSSSQPLVVQVLGTLVGNDPAFEKEKYGKILKPKIFKDSKAISGTVAEEPCVADTGINETTSLSAAYTLKFPNSGTAFYINKQGKYFSNIAASTNIDPMGSGESAEINLQGHAKISLGNNVSRNRSLTLNSSGGIYTNWGFDNDKGRSWDATFRRAVSWNILGADKDGSSFLLRISGDMRETIEGTKYSEIKGSSLSLVQGSLENKILGKTSNQYVGDYNASYGGKKVEVHLGHSNQTFSTGVSKTILAPNLLAGNLNSESTQIKTGNYLHKMFFGSKNEEVVIGNYNTKIGFGNRSVSVGIGNYSVSCRLGNINIKTGLGSINVKTNGQVTVEGKLSVSIKSAIKVKVEAPMVDIGQNKPLQGIVTGGPAGHKDYLTGLPLVGSVTCKASAR